jgi:integrase
MVKTSEAKILTEAAIKKYQPAAKRRRIKDALAKSLFLVIEPSGHKAWQMRFRRPDGKPGKITLGPVDFSNHELDGEPQIGQPLTLSGARLLAASVHRRRELGQDPIGDNKARKHRQRAEIEERKASAFGAAARDYIEEYARPNTRNWRETAKMFGFLYAAEGTDPEEARGGLAQRWGAKPVREIDGHDIWSVIEEARRIGIPGLVARHKGLSEARARGMSAALSGLFGWLARHRRVDVNPCSNVHRPRPPDARDRVLTADEVRWFWQACESADAPRPGAPQPFGPLLRCLLLTGQRRDEVANMTRTELADDGVWRLPGERTKNGRPHLVPLPQLARDLIASVSKPGKFIFTTTGTTPVSGWSRVKRRLDDATIALARKERGCEVTIPPWRLHDLRRTAITGMAENLGIRPDVIEQVVNHVSGHKNGVAGVYNRSEMLPERRAALAAWARFVTLVIDRDLHSAHQMFVATSDDNRETFNVAVTKGGEHWARYLAMIGSNNVVPLHHKTGSS